MQAADNDDAFDESMLDFEDEVPCLCLVCDFGGREDELLLCDSCDAPYHASCLGMDGVPIEAWYCPSCVDNHIVTESVMREANTRSARATRRARASRPSRTRARTRSSASGVRRATGRSRQWDRAWQLVWDRLNHDLEEDQGDAAAAASRSADTDESAGSSGSRRRRRANRSREQREADEWRVWSLRLRIAEANGGSSYFRNTATLFFNSGADDDKETPEMTDSWNMLEQALDLEESAQPPTSGVRHRPSRTFADWHSKRSRPSITSEPENQSESPESSRKLKRPRVAHRRSDVGDVDHHSDSKTPATAASSIKTSSPPGTSGEGHSLMKSLLQDIRKPPSPSNEAHLATLTNSRLPNGEGTLPTPRSLSPLPPVGSPASTPVNFFRSPSGSPILAPSAESIPSPSADAKSPALSPTTRGYRDSSPPVLSLGADLVQTSSPVAVTNPSASTGSITSQLTLEEKTQIQEIVRDVLRPFYRSGDISKDRYTDINKKVSHVLYGLVLRDRDVGIQSKVEEDLQERKQVWINVAKANVESEVQTKVN